MKDVTLYIVGDSTLSSFNDNYYYPRYGYGTQIGNYLSDDISVCNLAMSGRSSKSFLKEDNYRILKESIKKGDFLLIGFGHNDEKSDDIERFTSANLGIDDKNSFIFTLNEYYIKLAKSVGATPILCTPIVRCSIDNDYSLACGHITKDGNYPAAIINLGKLSNTMVIDLTSLTKKRYEELGYLEARFYHAVTLANYKNNELVPYMESVDTTHLNIYGAKYVAYLVCKELKKSNCALGQYVVNLIEPTKLDLIPNLSYKPIDYKAPNLTNYKPQGQFSTTNDFYGTAFGDCGGSPKDLDCGFIAKSIDDGYLVGQDDGHHGKISLQSDGFAFCFKPIKADNNFKLEADCKIIKLGQKESAFGLMLRDDCYINQSVAKLPILSNYITAGILNNIDSSDCLFYREASVLKKDNNIVNINENDKIHCLIERIGQSMRVCVFINDKKYEHVFYDFDVLAIDKDNMYIGMFATRGSVVKFNNVKFELTGVSQGA